MPSVQSNTKSYDGTHSRKKRPRKTALSRRNRSTGTSLVVALFFVVAGAFLVYWVLELHARYTISLQSPLSVHFQWPLVVAHRVNSEEAHLAQADQRTPLTAYQQYACLKFGDACRIALAIQRAENPQGKCETYHYNSDGTLDWGYFQINTVHLQRPGVNLRDMLDCKTNIDFAYRLYSERDGFTAWSTYNNGTYRKFLRR